MHYNDRLLAHVKRAEQATQSAKADLLRPFGLTPAQQNALAVAAEHPGITSAELARRVLVTPQTMTSTLARLERDGLIIRATHELHRSLVEVRLTQRGTDIFTAADAAVSAYDTYLRDSINVTQLDSLSRTLAAVAAAAAQYPLPTTDMGAAPGDHG